MDMRKKKQKTLKQHILVTSASRVMSSPAVYPQVGCTECDCATALQTDRTLDDWVFGNPVLWYISNYGDRAIIVQLSCNYCAIIATEFTLCLPCAWNSFKTIADIPTYRVCVGRLENLQIPSHGRTEVLPWTTGVLVLHHFPPNPD